MDHLGQSCRLPRCSHRERKALPGRGKLDCSLHLKETNTFQYLAFSSAHPDSTHKGLIRGETLRALRASTDKDTFEKTRKVLMRHIIQRGYPRKLVDQVSGDINFTDRKAALKKPTQSDTQMPAFVCMFHPQVSRRCLRAALEPPVEHIPRARICYKRNKNLADSLVRAKLRNFKTPPKGHQRISLNSTLRWRVCSEPCGELNCQCCKHMPRKQNVFSSNGLTPFMTPLNTSCSTRHLVYLLECSRYPKRNMYVGQTQRAMKDRLNGHRAACKSMPIYNHLRRNPHSFQDVRVTILEVVRSGENLESREKEWIEKLNTTLPNGLNSKFS